MVNPPTTYLWANWFMTQWDLYIDNSSYAKNHQVFIKKLNFKLIIFLD